MRQKQPLHALRGFAPNEWANRRMGSLFYTGQKRKARVPYLSDLELIERLELDNGSSIPVGHPKGDRASGVIDVHSPNIGRTRQQVLGNRAHLGVQPRHPVRSHSAGPYLFVLVHNRVVRVAERRR